MARRRHLHPGGAWKVAYADFVTAMMALFLVLWLVSQDQKIKDAVQRSFTHPFSSKTEGTTGILPKTPDVKVAQVESRVGSFDSAAVVELNALRNLTQDLLKSLQDKDNDFNNTMQLDLSAEGLRINLFDRAGKPLFSPAGADFTEYGSWILTTLAWQLSRYPTFVVEIEGHTEKNAPAPREDYGAWELSADRANAARRKLVTNGVPPKQIRKVAGFADTSPMPNSAPAAEVNRRVAILLKVSSAKP